MRGPAAAAAISTNGTVCGPSASEIADAVKAVLKDSDDTDGPSIPESWLREYSWDGIADQVTEALLG